MNPQDLNHRSSLDESRLHPIYSVLLQSQFSNIFDFISINKMEDPKSNIIDVDSSNHTDIMSEEIENGLVNITFLNFHKFDAAEYSVFGAVLLCSAAIGVFYGCFGKGQKSTEEFLMADRNMATLPCALSLLCSFISSITILGNPAEIFLYGSQYGLIIFAFIPLTLSLSYLYVPVFHNLKLSSAYEYFELRFSWSVRFVASFLGIFHYVTYMSIVVYAPCLCIGQVTGINTRISMAVIFVVCIFYSTLGGLTAIIVADSLQALIILGSLAAIVGKGIYDIGGLEEVWDVSSQFGRTEFFNFDIDPRTRHTVWTAIIGGYLQWLPNFAATHSQIQRYLSMPNIASIRRALLLNLIGFTIIFALCYLAGLAIFAKYHACNPIEIGTVKTPDQLLPLFVMDTLGDYPGFPGLFVAGITCASLSSVSSGLNALSAIVTYDYLKNCMPNLTDATLLKLSRLFCVLFGLISFGFIFVVENLGNILPAAISISGIIIGPTLGVFTLGMFFPWANSTGSLLGLLASVKIMIGIVVGNILAGQENLLPDQTLPGLTTDECYPMGGNDTFSTVFNSSIFSDDNSMEDIQSANDFGSEFLLGVFSISPMWYPGLGCVLSIIFGLLFSLVFTVFEKSKLVNPDHLSPPVLWIFIKMFPKHSAKWIDIEEYPVPTSNSITSATMSLRSSDFSFKKESVCDMKLKRFSFLKGV